MNHAHSLPGEMWACIFGLLHLPALYAASQVCAYWRLIVFDHPLFWRDIKVTSLHARHLHWTQTRLSAGKTRPLSFWISLGYTNDDLVPNVLLPIIGDVLHRTISLRVELHNKYYAQLCAVLRRPAPLLQLLDLDISYPINALVDAPLPVDLFLAQAPLLRTVKLDSIILSETTIPAFKAAEAVQLRLRLPVQLFGVFPRMRELTIFGNRFENSAVFPPSVHAGFAQLQYLELGYDETENIRLLRLIPTTARIPRILFSSSDCETVVAAVSQLPGEQITLTFRSHSEGELRLSYASRALPDYVREFVEWNLRSRLRKGTSPLLESVLLDRMTAVRFGVSLWSVAAPFFIHHGVEFSRVQELTLLLDISDLNGRGCLPDSAPVFPQLKVVALQAMGDFVRLAVADIASFAQFVAGRAVALELHRVVLTGESGELARIFSSVLRTNRRFPA